MVHSITNDINVKEEQPLEKIVDHPTRKEMVQPITNK